MTELWRRCVERALSPLDIAWLPAFRAAFGLTMCVSMLRFIHYGWVDALFVAPRVRFQSWGFEWLPPLSARGFHALFWLLAGLALCAALGLFYRWALAGFLLGFGYLQVVDLTNYLNHYYLAWLLALLLLAAPAGRAASLDCVLGLCAPRHEVPRAWLWLFRFQVGVVYTFAGLAKAHADWLFHAEPLGIWLGGRSDLPGLGRLVSLPFAPALMSWAGFLFDTSIVWFLLWRRTRLVAYAMVIVFHTLTRLLFPIGMFPFIMVLGALVFFPADYPRRLRWLAATRWARAQGARHGHSRETRAAARAPSCASRKRAEYALALAAAYCLLQLALPLRYLAYGGNVRWHEQGMRFSWRVMVREKNGAVTFVVRQRSTGRTFHVSPRRYLTRLQEREVSAQPDLILRLAQHIHRDFARRGFGEVEVRVDAWASLNGRRMARLIDPEVDLVRVPDGLARARWILPEPAGPPPVLASVAPVSSRS